MLNGTMIVIMIVSVFVRELIYFRNTSGSREKINDLTPKLITIM